jgi:hypothetical protein
MFGTPLGGAGEDGDKRQSGVLFVGNFVEGWDRVIS